MRKMWDLNPRIAVKRSPVFKTGAINHSANFPLFLCPLNKIRTCTDITVQGILSPSCLPIPP